MGKSVTFFTMHSQRPPSKPPPCHHGEKNMMNQNKFYFAQKACLKKFLEVYKFFHVIAKNSLAIVRNYYEYMCTVLQFLQNLFCQKETMQIFIANVCNGPV
jgi:hypothetical protein